MSQEHRFCADVYAHLFPRIDRRKRIAVNPDGYAVIPLFKKGSPVPDLCFTLRGQYREVRIEGKLLHKDGKKVSVRPIQQKFWSQGAFCSHKPHLWIVATPDLNQCWLIDHEVIGPRLASKKGKKSPLNLWPGSPRPSGVSIQILVARIMSWVNAHRRRGKNGR